MPRPPHADSPVQGQPASAISTSGARRKGTSAGSRGPLDDTVVIVFALFGIVGGVFLPQYIALPPIVRAYLLATGTAALVYRFLGGIDGASFKVGSLKLTGALGALIGIALLINQAIIAETPQAYQVTGVVYDDKGAPISSFGPNDITVTPGGVLPGFDGKFTVTFAPQPGFDLQPQFPTLVINHGSLSAAIDLTPGARTDTQITRHGTQIALNSIHLHSQTGSPPGQALAPASSAVETASLAPTPERKP
jgi:hypothetical protein